MDDPELPLLQRIRSLELPVSHEDHHSNGRPRVTSAAEDKIIRVTCLIIYYVQHRRAETESR
jgi:hypothetical protein